MSGPKRNPDRINTIGIVVVGLCGAVLVYVTIVALEAFYVNDTSEIQTIADYGGQDTTQRSLRTDQLNRISEYASNPKPAAPKANEAPRSQSYRVPVDIAMKLVVDAAKADPSSLVPVVGRSDKATVLPIFGRPTPIAAAAPAAAPAPAAGAAPAPGAAAPGTLPAAPQVSTGTGAGPSPVNGAGALDKAATPGTPENPTGPAPANTMKGTNAAGTATGAGANAKPKAAATPKTTAPKGNGK
jgi:hypothetical protein